MGKLELKIGFNGEQKSLFNQISEFEYLVQEPDNFHFARIDLAYDDYTEALNLQRIDMHRTLHTSY